MSRGFAAVALAVGALTAVPLLLGRPTVPPPRSRPPAEPARLDTDGAPLPGGALARAGTLRFRHGGEIGSVALSPDGRTAYTVGPAAPDSPPVKGVRCWSLTDGREKAAIGNAPYCAVDVSSDGKWIATGED